MGEWLGEGCIKEGRAQSKEEDEASPASLEVWVHQVSGVHNAWWWMEGSRSHLSDTGLVLLRVSYSRNRPEGEHNETKTQVTLSASRIPTNWKGVRTPQHQGLLILLCL